MIEFIRKARRQVLRRIRQAISPKLRKSGYTTGPLGKSRPLLLCVFMKGGKPDPDKTATVRNAMVLEPFQGFCEHGPITDAYGGGMVHTTWDAIPLEDLLKLETMLPRILPQMG